MTVLVIVALVWYTVWATLRYFAERRRRAQRRYADAYRKATEELDKDDAYREATEGLDKSP